MGRRKLTDAPAHRSVNLPESIALRWDMEFFSEAEGRIKAGKSELVATLLKQHFDEKDGTRMPYDELLARYESLKRADEERIANGAL